MNHEEAFVSIFVVPEKRSRYVDFLRNPKRRSDVTRRFSHFFDFVPQFAKQVPRGSSFEMARLLTAQGADTIAHVIGGRDEIDGKELPLEEAINHALADPNGTVVSCCPGKLALLLHEFPPGDAFVLSHK